MFKNKKLFLFDIDGVIKIGDKLIDGALDLYNYINKIGGKSVFITNNSTKNTADYVKTFCEYGFEGIEKSNFVTALTVTVDYLLKNHKNDLIFVMATKSLILELKKHGLNVTDKIVEGIDVVLIGYDNELTYDKVFNVCQILQTQKVEYLATNLDLRCPMPFGFVPDCGAITNMIDYAVDRKPYFLGKPSPEMIIKSMEENGFSREQTLVVGDRLYTDIACGINAGVDTCVVLSGEAKKEDLEISDIKPTYCCKNVKELLNNLVNNHS